MLIWTLKLFFFVHVGQTKRALKICISEHKTAIRTQNMEYATGLHYAQANNGSAASFKFWGIEKNITQRWRHYELTALQRAIMD